ncbi:MAG TPA: hypothetical protein VFU15_12855 [Bacteroidia bacterium]|nr:hypothetical protein [Bacteroidia bacterium]
MFFCCTTSRRVLTWPPDVLLPFPAPWQPDCERVCGSPGAPVLVEVPPAFTGSVGVPGGHKRKKTGARQSGKE